MDNVVVLAGAAVALILVAAIAMTGLMATVSIAAFFVVTSRVDHGRSDDIESSLLSDSMD